MSKQKKQDKVRWTLELAWKHRDEHPVTREREGLPWPETSHDWEYVYLRSSLPAEEKFVAVRIAKAWNAGKQTATLGIKTIAYETSLAYGRVVEIMTWLHERSLISWRYAGRNHNEYRLLEHWPEDECAPCIAKAQDPVGHAKKAEKATRSARKYDRRKPKQSPQEPSPQEPSPQEASPNGKASHPLTAEAIGEAKDADVEGALDGLLDAVRDGLPD